MNLKRGARRAALGQSDGTVSELTRRVASFPTWHYEIDLGEVKTPVRDPRWANRHRERREYIMPAVTEAAGGSLRGLRILDLGSNAGFWSLAALEAGADFVLGVDGRAMHIAQAELVFEALGVASDRYRFIEGDVFGLDLDAYGGFDVVLCLGLLYHVRYPMELVELTARASRFAVIDTTLWRADESFLVLGQDLPLDDPRSALDRSLVMTPTPAAVRDLARAAGFSRVVELEPRFRDYTGAEDYERGDRRAFLCFRETVAYQPTSRQGA